MPLAQPFMHPGIRVSGHRHGCFPVATEGFALRCRHVLAGGEEVGDPRYILDLLARIVTVSLETMAIVDTLPMLEVLPTQVSP